MRRLSLIALPICATFGPACAGSGQTSCGDLFLDGDETCDDGNGVPGDGCDNECQLECGNGVLDENEECEDGNRDAYDGCDSECQLECGNGILDGGEECEPALTPRDCSDECLWVLPEADIELPEPGGSASVPGELDAASPLWHRPVGSCTTYSGLTGDCAYEGYVVRNVGGLTATVTVDALARGSGAGTLADSMLFLYEGGWPPHDPLACVASDDDGGDEGLDARLTEVEVEPDKDYYLVISSFRDLESDDRFGTFELVVSVR